MVVGSGGREHALAWSLAASPLVSQVCVAPGNAGTSAGNHPKLVNVPIGALAVDELSAFATEQNIALTVIGPEAALAAGLADAFAARNLPCLGPTRAAAQLESSKIFAKEFMRRHHIPTADWQSFDGPEVGAEPPAPPRRPHRHQGRRPRRRQRRRCRPRLGAGRGGAGADHGRATLRGPPSSAY